MREGRERGRAREEEDHREPRTGKGAGGGREGEEREEALRPRNPGQENWARGRPLPQGLRREGAARTGPGQQMRGGRLGRRLENAGRDLFELKPAERRGDPWDP